MKRNHRAVGIEKKATCISTICGGTAVTKLCIFGIPERVIAEIMAWEEGHVAKIIRRYADRSAATKALIRQINERRT